MVGDSGRVALGNGEGGLLRQQGGVSQDGRGGAQDTE